VMYKQGTRGTYSYQGREHSQLSLFSTEPDVTELESFLLDEFAGQKISFDDIVDATLDSPFIEPHYGEVLKKLSKENIIRKIHVTTKTDRGFSGGDIAIFPPKKPKKRKKIKIKQFKI